MAEFEKDLPTILHSLNRAYSDINDRTVDRFTGDSIERQWNAGASAVGADI